MTTNMEFPGAPSMLASVARIHWRHGCPICSAAPSGQVPKPHRGAPKARDLTAKARTGLPSTRREDRLSPDGIRGFDDEPRRSPFDAALHHRGVRRHTPTAEHGSLKRGNHQDAISIACSPPRRRERGHVLAFEEPGHLLHARRERSWPSSRSAAQPKHQFRRRSAAI
jgi:hypothetical protein